jgi:uncharacterized protein YjdB
MKHFIYCLLVLSALGVATLGLIGCGGGNSTQTQNSGMTFRIQWPERSETRVIPSAAQSVQVELVEALQQGQTTQARQIRTLNRPTTGTISQVVFLGVNSASVSLTGRAYSDKDAQGTLLAQSAINVNLLTTPTVDLTLNSTLTSITLTPTPFSVAVGASQKVNATGKDSAGNLVPLTVSASRWTSADEGIARVDSSGNVTGARVGTTTITYQDTEANRSANLAVTVTNAPSSGQ